MSAFSTQSTSLSFWRSRAARHGSRAVVNMACADHDLGVLTERHRKIILPLLSSLLRGTDQFALDFGCGAGRFTHELAKSLHGKAIGMDIVQSLLDLAPRTEDVEYQLMGEGQIPLAAQSVDVLFVFGVLGGITDRRILGETILELDRVLRPGGLIFLVENTSSQPSAAHWIYRSYAEYRRLIDFALLKHLADYHEASERMTVMAGRKQIGLAQDV
jgi:ubiquinone/menaquinone biosynthesis C-methylase UbiE